MELNQYNIYAKGPRKGQPKTLTDRVVRFLIEGLKATEIPFNGKRRKFLKSGAENSFYWVGKNGSIRAGRILSKSMSMTGFMHHRMEIWEKREGK